MAHMRSHMRKLAEEYCALVGIPTHTEPMKYCARQITRMVIALVQDLEVGRAELRQAMFNPRDPYPLSDRAEKLLYLLREIVDEGSEWSQILNFLSGCPTHSRLNQDQSPIGRIQHQLRGGLKKVG